jgi:hypothetical protein
MTNEEALKEYEAALELILTYWDAPETKDVGWWLGALDRETRAWQELRSHKLLDSFGYFDLVTSAHCKANSLRVAQQNPAS